MKKNRILLNCLRIAPPGRALWTLLVIATLFMAPALSQTAFAESVAPTNITISKKGVSLEQLLWEIRKQCNFQFVYGTKDVDEYKNITIEVKNATVGEVLQNALAGTSLYYEIKDNVVYIKKKDQQPAKPKTIKGTVTDEKGAPLAGATVMVKGTKFITASDGSGNFSITIPGDITPILQISFIGMKTREEKILKDIVKFVLQADALQMGEVVVYSTGYQKIDKRLSTSSIFSVSGENLKQSSATSLDNMLMGKIPGMTVMNSSSTPGASTKIRIRGASTISGNREPLWVVDGIILDDPVPLSTEEINSLDNVNLIGNAISGLNPMDIETVDILKDASSTAIYGVRAANGVIVVTTKKGRLGTPKVSYSGTFNVTERPDYSKLHRMNSIQRIGVSKEIEERGLLYSLPPASVGYEGALYDLYDRKITEQEFLERVKRMEEVNTDWFGLLYRTAFSHKHNVSVSGATDKVNYYFSGAYSGDQNTVRGSGVNQYNANMRLIFNLSKKLTANIQLRGSLTDKEYLHGSISPYSYAYNTSRAIEAFDVNGNRSFYNMKQGNQQQLVYNILNEIDNTGNQINNNSLNFVGNIEWKAMKDLRFTGTIGLNTANTEEKEWFGEKSYYAANLRNINYGTKFPSIDPNSPFVKEQCSLPYGGGLKNSNTRNIGFTARAQVDYSYKLKESNEFSFAAGTEIRSTKYTGIRTTQFGYMPDRGEKFIAIDPAFWPKYNAMVLANPNVITNRLSNFVSFYGIATYAYKHKYILNFNVRADGSNKFGQDKSARFLPIWSLSAKANLHNEKFFKNIEWLNELAIKGSMGVQGNVSDEQTPSLILQGGPLDPLTQEYMNYLSKLPNPKLRWEKTTAYNIAMDFSVLNNRISGTFEYYYKKGVDQIITKTVSPTTGFGSMSLNAGDIVNKGYEVILNFVPVRMKDWTWSLSFNGAKNTNNVVRSGLSSNYSYVEYINGTAVLANTPVNTFFSYKYAGLDSRGLPKFYDIDELPGDTKQSMFDKAFVKSGTRIPDIQGGFGSTLKYKNITLNLFFTYSLGAKIRLNNLYSDSGQRLPQPQQNMSDEFVNRWRQAGDENFTNIPVLSGDQLPMFGFGSTRAFEIANNMWQMYNKSDLRVVSADHVRLRTASIRYQIPENLCKKAGLGNAYVKFEGNNLLLFASKKLRGQDPDQISLGGQTSPLLPSYSVSIDITF